MRSTIDSNKVMRLVAEEFQDEITKIAMLALTDGVKLENSIIICVVLLSGLLHEERIIIKRKI
jgi:hypothetical protein